VVLDQALSDSAKSPQPAGNTDSRPPRETTARGGTLSPVVRALSWPLYPFVAAILSIVRFAPRSVLPALGRGLGWCYRKLARRELRRARLSLRCVLGLPENEALDRLADAVLDHQAMAGVESVREFFRPGTAMLENPEQLRSFVADTELRSDRGVILVTAHLGSWELVGKWVAERADRSFYALARQSPFPAFTRLMVRTRRQTRMRILWAEDPGLVSRMRAALKAGDWLGFVMDQKPRDRGAVRVEFLGLPADFVTGPAIMAVRSQAAVVSAFAVRTGSLRYRMITRELLPAGHGLRSVQEVTELMAAEIARVIRLHPEQWCWNYRRWTQAELLRHLGVTS